ncbi:MAG: hypothetical protein HYY02_01025 [Chloroflexi bacterium]|nr:hypothetical protein [Chloroflexota bacterium]
MPGLARLRRALLIALGILALLAGGSALSWGGAQAGVDRAPAQGATSALWSGSILVQNNGSGPATVVVNFYSTAGVLVKSYSLPNPIPPKGTAEVSTEAIGDLPNGFAGSAVVSANQPVSATFQAFDVTNPSINRTLYNGFAEGAATVYVPAISNAYADQTSLLAVQNVDSAPATITIRYFERFTGAQTATVTDTIPANSSHFYDSANLPGGQRLAPPWTGAALIQASGARVVAAVHQPYLTSNKAVAFEGTGQAGNTVYLPSALYLYATQQQTSFIAVQNTQATPVSVAIIFYNRDGTVAGKVSGDIQGYQKQSWNPGVAGVPSGFNGSAVVQATGPVASVVNIGSATDLSMAYTGQISGNLKQALPYIRWAPATDLQGWRTYIAVMNLDTNLPADVTIRYYDQNGSLVQAPMLQGIPPNAKANHHPGMFVGEGSFMGAVEIEATRTVIALVNAVRVDSTQAESYTSLPIP